MRVDFRGKYGNCWKMDSAKYRNILEYVKGQNYPESFSKNEKLILRKFCKNFEYDDQTDLLFSIDKRRDGSTLKRLVIKEDEKSRVFEECHSADFSGHAGRDNTIRKIKQRYYWPDYYKDTVEMVRKFHLRCHACMLVGSSFYFALSAYIPEHVFSASHYTSKFKKPSRNIKFSAA